MTSIADNRREFRRLHESGCFVIPNPWDVGSAKYLASLGFKALATTSAGAAWSMGYADGGCPAGRDAGPYRGGGARHRSAGQCRLRRRPRRRRRRLSPERVACCVETGVAGLSIEDYTNDRDDPIYDFDLAVARVKAARAAIDEAGGDVILVGRAEGLIRNRPDFDDIIRRLDAYSRAGADCLYAPGVTTRGADFRHRQGRGPQARQRADGHAERPVGQRPRRTRRAPHQHRRLARAQRLGRLCARRKEIAEQGTFNGFKDAMPSAEINKLLGQLKMQRPEPRLSGWRRRRHHPRQTAGRGRAEGPVRPYREARCRAPRRRSVAGR